MQGQNPGWTAGYVTEIDYTTSFFGELAPIHLTYLAALQGVSAPDIARPFRYCELGCGNGFSTALLAACYPHAEFVGVDFNPNHVMNARGLAEEAGLDNLRYLEAGFADLPGHAEIGGGFDFIVLHGVYSWVDAERRAEIQRFIASHLKTGGLVYISYNCLPGLAAIMPLRQLLVEAGKRAVGGVTERLKAGSELAKHLRAANALFFTGNPAAGDRLKSFDNHGAPYLVHEYLNQAWDPLYFADVAADLAEAKLSFLAPANPIDLIEVLCLPEGGRAVLDQQPDPVMRETVRDYLRNTAFRKDIFVRGSARLSTAQRARDWDKRYFALRQPVEDCALNTATPSGRVELKATIYQPILEVLADGPISRLALGLDPRCAALPAADVSDALRVLIAVNYVAPAVAPEQAAAATPRATALNRAIIARNRVGAALPALAAPAVGSGRVVDITDQFALEHVGDVDGNWVSAVDRDLITAGRRLMHDGEMIRDSAEHRRRLEVLLVAFKERRLPVYRHQGLAGG